MRINQKILVSPGNPVQVSRYPVLASEIFIQVLPGSNGSAFVVDGVPYGSNPSGVTPTAVLSPAGTPASGSPGGDYRDSSESGINLQELWIDGMAGVQVVVSARMKDFK